MALPSSAALCLHAAQALLQSGEAASQWWEIVVISCSAVSAVCGLAVMAFHLARATCRFSAGGFPLGVVASLVGATAHVGMLTCYTSERGWENAARDGAASAPRVLVLSG